MSPGPGPSDPLMRAALFAGRAPSLHNSQPWHWYVQAGQLELRLEPSRVLRAADPDARLAILSCGAALHHARIHLAAAGWRIDVIRLPDPDDPGLLAEVVLGEPAPADPDAVRLAGVVQRRATDRRNFSAAPVDLHRVHSVRGAICRERADLTLLRPDQVIRLGQAAEYAYQADSGAAGRRESAAWIGGDRSVGTGIPAAALPADPYRLGLAEPARLMRRAGTALIAESHHRAAVFAVLSTAGEGRFDWLAAGQALSAGWLTATTLGIAVLPLSVVTEVAASRDLLRPLLRPPGNPQLVLRLATASDTCSPATPRLAPEAFVSRRPSADVR
ncbi:nitroreductase [Actinoplanes sp. KI2]|uniref:Acg family FMN-binding oxidoreductase n=1 Tax=Actinoplanes sp. KI2 TaxID=2983315 RepID=UPI0021D5C1E5|nr:nitroreductase [Actinoplanes sp. KI2]MCU7731118.1 nitroreductase [Actinoplanes sp. KI2]